MKMRYLTNQELMLLRIAECRGGTLPSAVEDVADLLEKGAARVGASLNSLVTAGFFEYSVKGASHYSLTGAGREAVADHK